MKKILLPALLLFLAAGPALADLYQWRDEAGIIHITDSMEKVPSKYRDGVKVFKEGPKEGAPPEEAPPADEETPPDLDAAPPSLDGQAEELYGDQTLEWWTQSFKEKRSEISALQESVDTKADFMKVFEAGRKFGQVYDSESVEKYKVYQKELPEDRRKLASLREKYAEFKERARRARVPDEVREP